MVTCLWTGSLYAIIITGSTGFVFIKMKQITIVLQRQTKLDMKVLGENYLQQRDGPSKETGIFQSNNLNGTMAPDSSSHKEKNTIQGVTCEKEDQPVPMVHTAETVNGDNMTEDGVILMVTEDNTSNEIQNVIDALLSNSDLVDMLNENTDARKSILKSTDFYTEVNGHPPPQLQKMWKSPVS